MPSCLTCGESNLEGARFCSSCGARLEREPTTTVEVRKTVTVLFADIVGSTSLVDELEPESARRVLDRFFETMRSVVKSHGGTVEKFIGDAVMAVFGIPLLHEDDALRAVRAAAQMRDALETLNAELQGTLGVRIQMRVGVNTGEVVAGDPASGQAFVTGDAVNVAARLEAIAEPGEIVIGESTQRLVRHAMTAERIGARTLKGRAEAVTAYRLIAAVPDAGGKSRRLEGRLVGRVNELALLSEAFESVARDRSCHLVTVVGTAGVGKSRLVEEFLAGRGDDATIVRGRCLPYGEGITFWPITEMINGAAGLRGDESPEAAREKIRDLVTPADDAGLVAEQLAQITGLDDARQRAQLSLWPIRRLFEILSRDRPLVAVFDDIQWAEPAFLDAVEYVVDRSEGAPILVLCMARPELMEVRLTWASREERAAPIFLGPLSNDECGSLIGNLLGGGELTEATRARIVEAANGLPLFVEEMVAMLIEEGTLRRENGRWDADDLSRLAIPATIQALLAARLDRLSPAERAVLERGSVEGQVFHRGAVVHLSPEPERPDVEGRLTELVLKELIEPESAGFADEDAFRFHHLLVRDIAYESVHKEARADLHERFAAWLEEQVGDRAPEYDEILGYHLEQAYRYETELRPTAVDGRLAKRAAERLGSAGLRAHARGDWSASATLLTRAVRLLPRDSGEWAKLEATRADALLEIEPGRVSFLTSARCFWRWPLGHKWTIRQRHGVLVQCCTRCGKEHRNRSLDARRHTMETQSASMARAQSGSDSGGGGS